MNADLSIYSADSRRRPLALRVALVAALAVVGALSPPGGLAGRNGHPRQVRVEVKVLEWITRNSLDYGFTVAYTKQPGSGSNLESADLTLPSQSALNQGVRMFLDNIALNAGNIEVIIEALEQYGSVRYVSEPTVLCPVQCKDESGGFYLEEVMAKKSRPNMEKTYSAKVQSGARVPYAAAKSVGSTLVEITEFKDVGVSLRVGAEDIIADEYVVLNIDTSVTNLAGYISVGKNSEGDPLEVPEIDTRSIVNTILVKNDTYLIMGILKTSSDVVSESGVPWLSEIPWLGKLFRSHSEERRSRELLFLVRPTILDIELP